MAHSHASSRQSQLPWRLGAQSQFHINTREPLELKPKSIYCVEVMKRWGKLPAILVLGVVLLLVGLGVSTWQMYRFRLSEYATFREKSTRLTGVFARAVGGRIARGQLDAIESMAEITLAGSGQYVWIQFRDQVLLDKRTDEPTIQSLSIALHQSLREVEIESELRNGGLDVTYPFSLPGQSGTVAGIVRIGFSDRAARGIVSRHRAVVLGAMVGSWLLVMLAVAFLSVIRPRNQRRSEEQQLTEPAGLIEAGSMRIDTDRSEVRLGGQLIELTPKMFDLLAFLARSPGKTYSDDELLEALWEDSAYAASNDVKQCIYMLRRRLKAGHPDPKRIIVNVKGFGYKLVPPDEPVLNSD